MNLNTPIKNINKIASDLAPKFKKLGLQTIQDLLFYYPYRYDDYSKLIKIQDILPNTLTTLRVKVELITARRSFRKRMMITQAMVSDETGQIKILWFNSRYVIKILQVGSECYLSGKPIVTENGIEFHNPVFEKIGKTEKETTHTNRLVPIYSSTEKLSQKQIRFILKNILSSASQLQEWLPKEIIKNEKLFSLSQAIHQIHFPISKENLTHAKRRLKFDEIFLLQLRAGIIKLELLKLSAPKILFQEKVTKKFVDDLPFKLTLAQKKSAWEIIKDTQQDKPMNRLLEGDVGSGKTVTVALPILNTVLNKFQVAYMAPTEILAQQHFKTFKQLFKNYDFNILLLTRSNSILYNTKTKKQEKLKKPQAIKNLANKKNKPNFIIGTHALIQEKIKFNNLALVIIDEQHRFGVAQRKTLKEKAGNNLTPHLISMTATPIPRSLALTVYGELDLSIIDEMPKDRKAIKTKVIQPAQRAEAYEFIKNEIKNNHQVFIVCPLIDPSDKLGSKAVKEEFEKLDKKIFPQIEIGLLHGRLKADEKEKIMQEFSKNKIKILVSTLVVEVGIDVPNATVMMIESAERFGLAQLHQLRGRVGRSNHQSYCFLFTESDSDTTIKRMHALVSSKNGFELAEKDLEFRGPGEVYGIRQSGYVDFLKIAKLTDWPIIKSVKPWVDKILTTDSKLEKHISLKNKLTDFEKNIHLE
ncbi:ATP-dependent DNA helicase RecG [Patescibacteria group bacterium]